jgi:dienelactone hydrolase
MNVGLTRFVWRFGWLTTLAVGSSARAQQRVMIPVPSEDGTAQHIRLETFVYRPAGAGPFPLVLLSHGSAAGTPQASLPARNLAAFFVARGYAVIVPMRRGRGESTGRSREYEDRHCDPEAWTPGIRDAMEDVSAALDYAGAVREIDTSRVVLAGVSRGGFLSVAYAAEGPDRRRVRGVINFVGAWIAQREDRCAQDFNAVAFTKFGSETSVPMLWLYGDGDPFNTTPDIREYASRFRRVGGDAEFVLFPSVPGGGHAVADTPSLWSEAVDRFLKRISRTAVSPSRMPANDR